MPDQTLTFTPDQLELLEQVRQQQGLESIQQVAEWLAKREQSARGRTARQERAAQPEDVGAQRKRAAAQSRASAAREANVAAGVAELDRWLRDLVRSGLADAPGRPRRFWEAIAARMVDAQAPGLARMLRELPGIAASGAGWQERLLEHLARLFLLLEGYRRLETLSPAAYVGCSCCTRSATSR